MANVVLLTQGLTIHSTTSNATLGPSGWIIQDLELPGKVSGRLIGTCERRWSNGRWTETSGIECRRGGILLPPRSLGTVGVLLPVISTSLVTAAEEVGIERRLHAVKAWESISWQVQRIAEVY